MYARFGAEVGLDVALLTVAYYTSYLVRFEGFPETAWIGLFVPALHPLYDYAWFVGFAAAAVAHWALMKALPPQPVIGVEAVA